MDKRQMPFAKLQKMVGERVLLTIDLYYPDICHQSRSFELNIIYRVIYTVWEYMLLRVLAHLF